jgi:hypothetical protein
MEEVERSAEEVNADVVEVVEEAHEVMAGDVLVMTLDVLDIDGEKRTGNSMLLLPNPPASPLYDENHVHVIRGRVQSR